MIQLEPKEVAFGLHFLAELTLDPQLGEKLYRKLANQCPGVFTGRAIQPGPVFVYFNMARSSRMVLTETNLLLQTTAGQDSPSEFLKCCQAITENLIDVFELNPECLKTIGKVFRYELKYESAQMALKNLLPSFGGDAVRSVRIRATERKEGRNIHWQFASIEQDGELVTDRIFVECDINNADQNKGHRADQVTEILQYADEYQKDHLRIFVIKALGIGESS